MVAIYALRAVLVFLLALAVWHVACRVGSRPGPWRTAAAAFGVVVAVGGALFEIRQSPLIVRGLDLAPLLALCEAGYVACCGGALWLLGLVWGAPERTVRPAFLAVGVATAVGVLGGASLGFSWWPLLPDTMANYPDEDGMVRQSTNTTCVAAAGAMLADRAGLRLSEGDVAELANTSPFFGSKPIAMAVGLDHMLRGRGWRAHSARLSWEQCRALRRPVVVALYLPHTRLGHAVLLEVLDSRGALVADPEEADRRRMSRGELEATWNPMVVWLAPGK
jgi:hypothetical protein